MKKISVSKIIDAEIDIVWLLFSEFDLVHKFHPMVKTSPSQSNNNSGTGAERVCTMYNGMKAKEVITDCRDHEYLKIDIVDSPMPFSQAYGEFYFIELDENTTRINIDMWMQPKFGVFGKMLYSLVMKKQLTGMLNGVLEGLNNYLTTGCLIGKNGKKLEQDPDFVKQIKHIRAA